MDGMKISRTQLEKLEEEINKAIAVAVVLENELGVQQDSVSANAVCVIKEYIERVRDMVKAIDSENEQYEENESLS